MVVAVPGGGRTAVSALERILDAVLTAADRWPVAGGRWRGGADTGAARIRWPRRAPLTQGEHAASLSPPCQLQRRACPPPPTQARSDRVQPPAAVRQLQKKNSQARLQVMPFVAGPAGGAAATAAVWLMCGY